MIYSYYGRVLPTLRLGYSHEDRLGRPTVGMPVYRKARPQNADLAQLDAEAHAPRAFDKPRLTGGVPLEFR